MTTYLFPPTLRSQSRLRARRGFTLIELFVVMALTAALGALTLGLLPGIVNKDNTLKATAEVQGALRIAQGHAASAKRPRGVRFLTNGNGVATEMQYLEAPEVVVSDLQVLVQGRPTQPFVQFEYEYYNGSEASIDPRVPGNPVAGAIKRRHCILSGLNGDQTGALGVGATLNIPTLSFWSQIQSYNATTREAVLEVYPDPYLGAAGPPAGGPTGQQPVYRSYHFGLYGAPVPQLGEPTVPLPKSIKATAAVDLLNSLPPGAPNVNYDIMFAPNGQTVGTRFSNGTQIAANAGVYLWVRDVAKVPTLNQNNPAHFRTGGEQQIVGVRNGYVGTAPVEWPDLTTGAYSRSPYQLARERLD
jgi:prepilin-type N-terminal cleavage/methylation domain-containing protein